MSKHNRPTPEELAKLFDPEGVKVGKLIWAVSPRSRVKAGDEAGSVGRHGRAWYRNVQINNVCYPSHVLVWAICNGRWPASGCHVCHHPNTDGLDNRPENLCEQPHLINCKERRHTVGGTSVFQGVSWDMDMGKWRADLRPNRYHIYLGHFTDEILAARMYDTAALLAFGEWANTNAKVHGWKHEPIELPAHIVAKIENARTDVAHNEVRNAYMRAYRAHKKAAHTELKEAA